MTFVVILAPALGCAALAPKTPEEIVGARALEQARALQAGDYDSALDYMTPAYRSSPRARDYQRNRAGSGGWQDVVLKWVKCDPESARCEVRLLIYVIRPPAVNTPLPVPLDDTWIEVDGVWYQYD